MISLKSSKYPARARKIAWINKLNKFMNTPEGRFKIPATISWKKSSLVKGNLNKHKM